GIHAHHPLGRAVFRQGATNLTLGHRHWQHAMIRHPGAIGHLARHLGRAVATRGSWLWGASGNDWIAGPRAFLENEGHVDDSAGIGTATSGRMGERTPIPLMRSVYQPVATLSAPGVRQRHGSN